MIAPPKPTRTTLFFGELYDGRPRFIVGSTATRHKVVRQSVMPIHHRSHRPLKSTPRHQLGNRQGTRSNNQQDIESVAIQTQRNSLAVQKNLRVSVNSKENRKKHVVQKRCTVTAFSCSHVRNLDTVVRSPLRAHLMKKVKMKSVLKKISRCARVTATDDNRPDQQKKVRRQRVAATLAKCHMSLNVTRACTLIFQP
jgi:hypothetical protein